MTIPVLSGARRVTLATFTFAILLAVTACSGDQPGQTAADSSAASPESAPADAGGGIAGTVNRNGSMLAYEHDIAVRLPAKSIASNVSAAREACIAETLGQCTVLAEEMTAGDLPSASLKMRVEPKAVQGLVKLAAKGGEIGQRSTHAEDLAVAVRDNSMFRKRLQLQHDKLSQLLERRDAKLEDLIALNDKMSEIESQLMVLEQESAQQQRRINTNLLTLNFQADGVSAQNSRIPLALRGLGQTWDTSLATLITVVGALLPFVLFALLVWAVIRFIRRRRRAASIKPD